MFVSFGTLSDSNNTRLTYTAYVAMEGVAISIVLFFHEQVYG